jgi:hypothetical protein
MSARHVSSPFGSETTLGCTAAHRAVVESPEPVPPPDEGLMEIRRFAKILGPASGLKQCLGEMPWINRATAMWPDIRYVVNARTKIKECSANRRCWDSNRA